jgi:hypothetical protein
MNTTALECGMPGASSAVVYAHVRKGSHRHGPQNAHSARYRDPAETRSVVECTNCVSSRVMRDVSRYVSAWSGSSREQRQ